MNSDFALNLLHFAGTLADESRAILSAAVPGPAETKYDNSFVTQTDREIELRLRERIEVAFPYHGVLGEEFGSRDLDAEFVWVLDPIDGTAPFLAGIPVYGTLLAVARYGVPWLGVMDFPATGERWRGIDGAFAERNGQRMRTRSGRTLKEALASSSNPDFFSAEERRRFAILRDATSYFLYGASAYAFACLAGGRTDLSADSALQAYDVFAPAAVIGGAGGTVSDWSGNPLSLTKRQPILAAGDAELHAEALECLNRTPR